MKKIFATLLLVGFFSIGMYGQAPPLPPTKANTNNNVVGGSAPVGSGLLLLLGLAGAYTARKVYKLNKEEE